MKDNPLAQAVRETKASSQPVDMARMMQMIEEIHKAVVPNTAPGKNEKIITTQQSHS